MRSPSIQLHAAFHVMSTTSAQQKLNGWPAGRPIALAIIARRPAPALAGQLKAQLREQPELQAQWWLHGENAVAGDGLDAAYDWAALLSWSDPEPARRCLASITGHAEGAGIVVHLGRPAPGVARALMRGLQAVLQRLPIALNDQPLPVDARWEGGVNPSREQTEHMLTLPQHEPIGVLNLHRYHRQATDPYSGENHSGRDIAMRYLKRGLLTFTRVGGAIRWSASGLGQLHGPDEPAWQVIALVNYPGRAAFASMLCNPAFHQVIPYRKAGLEVAEVSMARVL